MRNKEKILEDFGKLIIHSCFDDKFLLIEYFRKNKSEINNTNWDIETDYIRNFVSKLSEEDYHNLKDLFYTIQESTLFSFLSLFTWSDEYKIVKVDNGMELNLSDLCENLKAEIYTELGWISRFSKISPPASPNL